MRKKSKKYIKGSVFAALLLAAISVRTVAGAGSVNSGGLLEVGEAVQEEDKETTHGYLGETDREDRGRPAALFLRDLSVGGAAGPPGLFSADLFHLSVRI